MLRERREAKRMSLLELARMARVGRIVKLESGDKKNPLLDVLNKVAASRGR